MTSGQTWGTSAGGGMDLVSGSDLPWTVSVRRRRTNINRLKLWDFTGRIFMKEKRVYSISYFIVEYICDFWWSIEYTKQVSNIMIILSYISSISNLYLLNISNIYICNSRDTPARTHLDGLSLVLRLNVQM